MDFQILFPLAAFALALLSSLRSLGWGLTAVAAVGYLNGVVRANYLGVYSTFMFDAGLLGLYVGFLAFHRPPSSLFRTTAGVFVLLLTAWPVLVAAVPVNDYLVQLVALRGTVWFLPVLLVATRLTGADLTTLARGLAVLNLGALAVGLYEFQNGVEILFPRNAVTDIMYRSADVAGGSHRIPSTFLSAHSYGGAMLFTLPFGLDRLFGPKSRVFDRLLAGCGVVAAVAGVLLCAARTPLVVLALAGGVSLVVMAVSAALTQQFSRANVWFVVGVVAIAGVGVGLASTSVRLQRAATLEDTDIVASRLGGSVNETFLDVLVSYPLGAGMGSSVGTSVPFFLADRAPEQIGLENEFSRITVDQGWVGLGLWLAFLVWLFVRPPHVRLNAPWQVGRVLMYSLLLASWGTAFIGTGALSAIPQSVLLLAQMGVLAGDRGRTKLAPPARPVR